MSSYFGLPSVQCIYFKESHRLFKVVGSKPIFSNPVELKDVDDLWIKKLSKADRKLLEKDLKKFKKI